MGFWIIPISITCCHTIGCILLCISCSDRFPIPYSWTKWIETSGLYFLALFLPCSSFSTNSSGKTIMNVLAQWVLFCACSNQQTVLFYICVLHCMTTSSYISENNTAGLHSLPDVWEIVTWIWACSMWTKLSTSWWVTFMFGKQCLPLHTEGLTLNNLHMCALSMLIKIIFLNIKQGVAESRDTF